MFFTTISCVDQQEVPLLDGEGHLVTKEVRDWFEANKSELLAKEQANNARVIDKNLILPYFEKEPDWFSFDEYRFADGRKVYEINISNLSGIVPVEFMEQYGDRSDELIEESMLFVEKTDGTGGYSVLIARYFSHGEKVKGMTYHRIPKNWSGRIDMFSYGEQHLRTFRVERGKLLSHLTYQLNPESAKSKQYNGFIKCDTYWIDFPYYPLHGGVAVGSFKSIEVTECYEVEFPDMSGGGSGSGSGGNSGPSSGFDDPDNICQGQDCFPFPGLESFEIIENNVEDPCMSAQVDLAINANFKNKITQLVWDAFGESENFHVHINAEDFGDDSVDGDASYFGPQDYVTFTVSLNTGALASSSKEYIMVTVFHELLHAYLGYLDIDTFSGDTQHNEMADNYLQLLADALMEHYSISQTDAIRLAWGGLHMTDKWNNLSSTKKNQILQTNSQYKSGNKGTPC